MDSEFYELVHDYEPLDEAPDYPELDSYPPADVALEAHYLSATEHRPLRYSFESGEMPDFPSVAPSSRLCSERLRGCIERLKSPQDGISWTPALLTRRCDGHEFRYWNLMFTNADDVRYYSWYDRIRARVVERRLKIANGLALAARTPYVLDRRKLKGKRVLSFGSLSSLYVHHDVAEALQSERVTNVRYLRARLAGGPT